MKFKNKLTFTSSQEFEESISKGNYELSKVVVDETIKNLKTKRKVIQVVSIYTLEEDIIFDITLDREDFLKTLEINLSLMEKFEDYERCQQIVEGIKHLKSENSEEPKLVSKRISKISKK